MGIAVMMNVIRRNYTLAKDGRANGATGNMLVSSSLICSVTQLDRWVAADVSGQSVGSVFKVKQPKSSGMWTQRRMAIQEDLNRSTLKDGTEPFCWNVGSYQSSLRNIREEGSLKSRILCVAASLQHVVITCCLLRCADVSSSDRRVQDV
jgi:hypothetical protein